MRHYSARPAALLAFSLIAAPNAFAQGRILDEGTFSVTRAGVSQTENFRIARVENGFIRATATVVSGSQRVTSTLTVDTLGMPTQYDVVVTDRGARSLSVKALGGGARLIAKTNNQGGDEAMREYPLTGQSLLLEEGLVHQLFFAAYGRKPGMIQVIDPRASRVTPGTLAAQGLEPVDVGGRSVTGTHYSLVAGGVRRDFWVDASGRLLRVEIPSAGLVAAREELPR